MRTDLDRLEDILEEIGLIEKYAKRGREAFYADELIQTWMVKHIENIGEACRAMTMDFRAQNTEIPWTDIIAQRTYLAHESFAIDQDEVWATIERDVPELKLKIEEILKECKRDP